MRKFLILLSLLLCVALFSLVGCSNNQGSTDNVPDSSQDNRNLYKEYEITLNVDNYWKYLDWDINNQKFTGVLVYAFYEQVVITLKRTISSEYSENIFTENYEIELNAAGCKNYNVREYTFDEVKTLLHYEDAYLGSWRSDYEIIHISGKVYFSI